MPSNATTTPKKHSEKRRGCGPPSGSKALVKTDATYLANYQLQPCDKYDIDTVFSHLGKINRNKPIAQYKLHAYSDAIKIKSASRFKKAHRKAYSYKEIDHYYNFQDYSDVLVLAIRDTLGQKKYYEFYQMNNKAIRDICNLLSDYKQTDQPVVEYRSEPNLMHPSEDIHVSSPLEHRAASVDEVQLIDRPYIEPSDSESIQESNELVENLHQVEYTPIQAHEVHVKSSAAPPMHNSNGHGGASDDDDFRSKAATLERFSRNMDRGSVLAYDMTFIKPDPVKGNTIDDTGSVFMFVAHYPHRRGEGSLDMVAESPKVEKCFEVTYLPA